MIRYTLKCDQDHTFESWFKSAAAYEALGAAGHLACPSCGTSLISKALMSPQLGNSKDKAEKSEPEKVLTLSAPSGPVEEALTNLRKAVEDSSEYVGTRFADTARKMHVGDIEQHSIHGEASRDDAKSLIDDGIPVLPLPFTPKSKAN